MKAPFSIYIHIPWCRRKCPYCDFNVHVAKPLPEARYCNALIAELRARCTDEAWRGRKVRSVYFGGGTPSHFSASAIARVIAETSDCVEFDSDLSIELEGNPEEIDAAQVKTLKEAGLSRLSLGVQSFNAAFLRMLGRRHCGADAFRAVHAAREGGVDDISVDLIFGIPGQDVPALLADIEEALALSPTHMSLYGLTVEEGTPFARHFEEGKFVLPDEETCAEMMSKGRERLERAGFEHYEISNYALPGRESRHNLAYWNGDDYLGLGAGAHSFHRQDAKRWANYAEPLHYMKTLEQGALPVAWTDRLSDEDLRFEFFFSGLRKRRGVREEDYRLAFHRDLFEDYETQLRDLKQQGCIETAGGTVRLSWKGVLLADSVIAEFSGPN